MANLPDEVIEDILLRLPVKSLLRFKTVSKKWYSLISEDIGFAKRHLQLTSSTTTSKNLLFFRSDDEKSIFFQSSDVDTCSWHQIKLSRRWCIVGSANGLVCVTTEWASQSTDCFLWNPFNGGCKKIPQRISSYYRWLRGFGYDSHSNDYKIVAFQGSDFKICSLKEDSWRIHKRGFPSPFYAKKNIATYFNGALYWYSDKAIVALDLATEEFFNVVSLESISLSYNSCPLVWVFKYQRSLWVSDGISIWPIKQRSSSKIEDKDIPVLYRQQGKPPVGVWRFREQVVPTKTEFEFVHTESLISPKYLDYGW